MPWPLLIGRPTGEIIWKDGLGSPVYWMFYQGQGYKTTLRRGPIGLCILLNSDWVIKIPGYSGNKYISSFHYT